MYKNGVLMKILKLASQMNYKYIVLKNLGRKSVYMKAIIDIDLHIL